MTERRFRFTKSSVDGLAIPTRDEVGTAGYTMVWDTQVTGFGLQLRPSGMKTFILVYRNKAGRVRRHTIGRYGRVTVDQAREAAKHHNGVIALGGDPVMDRKRDRTAKTLDEVFVRYIADHLTPNRSDQAVRSAKRVQRLIAKSLGKQLASELKPSGVRVALEKFRNRSGNYNLVRTCVAAAWNWGRDFGLIFDNARNPVDGVETLPSTPRSRRITEAEYRAAFKAINELVTERRNDPSRLLARVLVIATGCRPIGAVRLRRDHIHRDKGEAVLSEHKTFKRTGKPKVFFSTPLVLDILDRADALHRMRAVESEFVFPRRNQRQKASNWLAATWRSIRKRTGLDIELRQFRSGYINVAHDAGMTLDQIAGITQHASVGTVKRHYLIIERDNANKVAERLQQFRRKRLEGCKRPDRRACAMAGW
jgi:integrase